MESICEELGYAGNLSFFVRKLIFENVIATGNPKLVLNELYSIRAEFNKIGSNVNQIANFTNILHSKGINDNQYEQDFKKFAEELSQQLFKMRDVLDMTLRKIIK